MKGSRFLLFFIIFLSSCAAARFRRDKALFDSSVVTMSFRSVAEMNDTYFVLKENNFFEYYKLLFDSVKNSGFAGRYTKNGDTLLLDFYHKKGSKLLGKKALVTKDGKEIIFFTNYPGIRKRLNIN